MKDLGFGLEMTLAGMGSVFAILALLMVLLLLIGRLDRLPRKGDVSTPVAAAEPVTTAEPVAPSVRINASGLSDDQLAAIAIAVVTHADVRRKQAAPAMRVRQPGSQIHTNRWTTVGRGLQTQIHQQRRR